MSGGAGWGWPARLGAMAFSGVFMLGFGAGGIWGGILPLWQTFGTAIAARSYVTVPAQVLQTELVRYRGSKGSVTFEVRARYAYRWEGRDFEATRVGVGANGADNIGNWHDLWHQRLKQARDAEQPVPAWVDPQRPERALLDRSVRWGLVALHLPFAILFTAVGLGAAVVFFGALFDRLPDKSTSRPAKPGRRPAPASATAPRADPDTVADRVMRGRLDGGGEVLFRRRWPRWVGGLMLLALALWVASGPVERGGRVWVAAVWATAWVALALHLLTLRWTWRREADRLQVRKASWLHERRFELGRADLLALDDKLVYTSSTNGGPTVHHHALVARTSGGHAVALTPALPGPEALKAVRTHLRQAMGLAPQGAGANAGRQPR